MDSSKTTVIEPRSGWQFVRWRELFEYRDLIRYMVLRNVKAKYAQSILGLSWTVIQPFMTMVVFTVIFGNVANIPTDNIPAPIFYFSALIPWQYFSGSFSGASGSLTSSSGIFTKVYFPRVIVPLIPLFSKMVDFTIGAVFLVFMMIYFGFVPTANIVALPLLMLIMFLTAGGMGMLLTTLSVQYRDVQYAMSFLVRLLMYVAPVIYSVTLIQEKITEYGLPEWLYYVYGLFPMTGVIQGFRSAMVGGAPMPWDLIAIGGVVSVLVFFTGALIFKRKEQIFADIV